MLENKLIYQNKSYIEMQNNIAIILILFLARLYHIIVVKIKICLNITLKQFPYKFFLLN